MGVFSAGFLEVARAGIVCFSERGMWGENLEAVSRDQSWREARERDGHLESDPWGALKDHQCLRYKKNTYTWSLSLILVRRAPKTFRSYLL